MRYSDKQLILLRAFSEFLKKGINHVPLDDLICVVKDEIDPHNAHVNFRSGINACIRDLQRKVPKEGLLLNGNDKVGRGNKSEFLVSGPYEEVYKRENARRLQSEVAA